MITKKNISYARVSGTTSGVAGTRTNHAHGLPYTPLLTDILIQDQAPNSDANNSASVALVAVDATNITVKSAGTSIVFNAFVIASQNFTPHFTA